MSSGGRRREGLRLFFVFIFILLRQEHLHSFNLDSSLKQLERLTQQEQVEKEAKDSRDVGIRSVGDNYIDVYDIDL